MNLTDTHIAELTRQRDALLRKTRALEDIVREIPTMLTGARLDEAQGIPTKYDYTRHGKVLNMPEA